MPAVSAPVDWEPLIALLPDQPPEAVQAVARADAGLAGLVAVDVVKQECRPAVGEV